MSRGPDAATLLERALGASARAAAVAVAVTGARARAWASATFAGARHEVMLAGERSTAADAWLAALPEADLPLRGHLVADLSVMRVARSGDGFTAAIEVLTVEDR